MQCCNHGPKCDHLRLHYLCIECKAGLHPIEQDPDEWVEEQIADTYV